MQNPIIEEIFSDRPILFVNRDSKISPNQKIFEIRPERLISRTLYKVYRFQPIMNFNAWQEQKSSETQDVLRYKEQIVYKSADQTDCLRKILKWIAEQETHAERYGKRFARIEWYQ